LKKIWIFTLMVLCLLVTAVINPGNIIASTDEPQEEMQYDEGDEAAIDDDMIYEEPLMDEENDYDDEALPEDLMDIEEPAAKKAK